MKTLTISLIFLLSLCTINMQAAEEFITSEIHTSFDDVFDDNSAYGVRMNILGTHPPFVVRWGLNNEVTFETVTESTVYGFTPGDYVFTITDSEGLQVTELVTIDSRDVIIICDGECTILSIEEEPNFSCFNWFSTTFEISGTSSSSQNICPPTGKHVVEVDIIGEDGDVIDRKEFLILVETSTFDISPKEPFLCDQTSSINITAPFYENATYLWNTGEDDRVITVGSPGEYVVSITTTGGCERTGSVKVTMGLNSSSIKNIFEENGFVYLPILESVLPALRNPDSDNESLKQTSCPSMIHVLTESENRITIAEEFLFKTGGDDTPFLISEYYSSNCGDDSFVDNFFISNNESFCDDYQRVIDLFEDFYANTDEASVWIHTFDSGTEQALIIGSNFSDVNEHFAANENLIEFLDTPEIPIDQNNDWEDLTWKKFDAFAVEAGINWRRFPGNDPRRTYKMHLGVLFERSLAPLLNPNNGKRFTGGVYPHGEFFIGVSPPFGMPSDGFRRPDFVQDVDIDILNPDGGREKRLVFPVHARGAGVRQYFNRSDLAPAALIEVKLNESGPLPYNPEIFPNPNPNLIPPPHQIQTYIDYLNNKKFAIECDDPPGARSCSFFFDWTRVDQNPTEIFTASLELVSVYHPPALDGTPRVQVDPEIISKATAQNVRIFHSIVQYRINEEGQIMLRLREVGELTNFPAATTQSYSNDRYINSLLGGRIQLFNTTPVKWR